MQKTRRAASEDATRIAEIQVAGWKAAYRGIIPSDFYEAMGFAADGATKSEDRPGFTLEEMRYRIDPRRTAC